MERKAAYDMLGVCMQAAPNAQVQQAFTEMYNKLVGERFSVYYIVRVLAEKLVEGLAYGNWPEVTR